MRRVAIGIALACSGCAQIAGIESTSGDGRTGLTLAFDRMSIGAHVVHAPLALAGLDATYFPADGTRVPATVIDDVWTADLRDAAPVQFALPDDGPPFPRLWDFPDTALTGVFARLEHPNPTPAPTDAIVNLSVALETPYNGTDGFQTYTLGSWTIRGFSGVELPPLGAATFASTFPFSSVGSITGRPLEALTADDAFLFLRYAGAALTGAAEAPPFTQTSNDTVTATMAAVAADQTLTAHVAIADLGTRYAAVRPAVAGLAMNWSLNAAPGYAVASNTGPALNSGGIAVTDTGDLAIPYGNPFAARWNTVFTFATGESRTYTPDAATIAPAGLYAGMYQLLEPTAAAEALTLPAGLPEAISLEGVPLSTDGMTVPQPAGFATVTFIADRTDNTMYQITLYDLVVNAAGTGLDRVTVYAAAMAAPTVAIPAEVFVAGHTYTARAVCLAGGFPQIAAGNLMDRSLPIAVSYLDSAAFTVMP